MVALGRRVVYPLKLVEAPGHCFCRWDSPLERFNIEYHDRGLNIHSDESYRHWPVEWSAAMHEREARTPTFLKSLTAKQELASFAQTRASQLDIAGRWEEAVETIHVAYWLWPQRGYDAWVTH